MDEKTEIEEQLEKLERELPEVSKVPDVSSAQHPILDKYLARVNTLLTQAIVLYNKESSKATNVLVRLTWVIAFLTLVLVVLTLALLFRGS